MTNDFQAAVLKKRNKILLIRNARKFHCRNCQLISSVGKEAFMKCFRHVLNLSPGPLRLIWQRPRLFRRTFGQQLKNAAYKI